jgi:hypothetical protein
MPWKKRVSDVFPQALYGETYLIMQLLDQAKLLQDR